jgi:hypothetical protein
MQSVHENTGVPLTKLYSWRERGRAHAAWRTSHEHFEMTNRALPGDAEAIIAQFIRSNFVALGARPRAPNAKVNCLDADPLDGCRTVPGANDFEHE